MLMRCGAAVSAALAVATALWCVLWTVETVATVVAERDIPRGAVIGAGDVSLSRAPAAPQTRLALDEVHEVTNRVAQSDLVKGQPLYPSDVRDAPVTPTGRTVLRVRVASDVGTIIPGDTVMLSSTAGCEESSTCRLAKAALVMERPRPDRDGLQGGTLAVALTPDEAARVMALRDAGAIVAVQ